MLFFSVMRYDPADLRNPRKEDHYTRGGFGDAVLGALRVRVHKLAVRDIPQSGKPNELLQRYGLSAGPDSGNGKKRNNEGICGNTLML